MHYALPPRKTSQATPYPLRPNNTSQWRRFQANPRMLAVIVLGVLGIIFLAFRLIRGGFSDTPAFMQAPKGHPNVVLVTAIDPDLSSAITDPIKQNRESYAARHGYKTFFPKTTDYDLNDAPISWAKVPALRHAMTLFPKTPYFFFLDEHTLIMNFDLKIEEHIMAKARLESLMQVDAPIIPPDSVIKTFSGLKGDRIDLVMAQDKEGLLPNSFVLRRGDWAQYFLDAWFDPLYRSYNFQKAERHALEHIVQWHGTLLAKLALVPQKIMNSYTEKDSNVASDDGLYKEGDFIVFFGGCEKKDRDCQTEMSPYIARAGSRKEQQPS